jgi:hypothetical protein
LTLRGNLYLLRDATEGWIFDTSACVAETSHWPVIGPACELLLHGLRQDGSLDIGVLGCLRSELAVEVIRVTGVHLENVSELVIYYTAKDTYHVRPEAGLVLSLEELAPVNVGEEVVRLDFSSAVGAQSAHGITVQQSSEKIPSGRRDNVAGRESQRLLQDLAVHLVGVLIIEWGKARQHLVEQDTQSPPIDGLGVAIAKEKFGGEIFGGSTEG